MRIVSYNVWNEDKGVGNRSRQIIEEILNVNADLIALQEITPQFYREFLSNLSVYPYSEFGKYTDENEGLAILSKYPITDCTFLHTDRNYANSCALNVLLNINNIRVSVTDVHLPWDSIKAKEEQIVAIDRFSHEQSKKADYFIVLGDFNCGINSSVHRYMTGEQTICGNEAKPYWYEVSAVYAAVNRQELLPTLDCINNPRWKGKEATYAPENFARNHDHAEKIREVFYKKYPDLPGYARVIDNYMTYVQSAIDEFSDPARLPQIAISVDMLDTGIDVPEVLNLVFFKKVMSKAKFWQMIGRGTRLCAGLLDGEDKKNFYIFDFCGNFEFFRMHQGKPTANVMALQGAIFNLQFEISYKLQAMEYQTKRLVAYRKALTGCMADKVRRLNRENFAVRQHLKYVDLYSAEDNYRAISYEDTLAVREELAPLILPEADEAGALRFDALMYGIELAYLAGKKYAGARSDLYKKVSAVS